MNSIDTDSFIQKLKEYDEAFDFYMDYGKLPDSLPQGNFSFLPIGQRMKANSRLNRHKRRNRDWNKVQSLWLLTPAAP